MTAIVTGAGAGLGRAEALALAGAGAGVVINDLADEALAGTVAAIRELGAEVVPVAGDIGERATADRLIEAAQRSGGPHIVVNNAGLVRDRMLFNMTDDDWDLVVKVHLRGHFLLTRNAAAHWRAAAKAAGKPIYGRLINTSSEAGLLGPEGQANYGAAKAGITTLTLSAARVLARYGVRANAICPRARTAMTESVFGAVGVGADPLDPAHVGTFVSYLASPAADSVNGQLFVVYGGMVALLAAPTVEQRFDAVEGTWTAADLADRLGGYFADRDPNRTFSASDALRLS
ncbi:3-oxoacyl-ACP reductase [Skermania piniformis]|nr:3-oxoacyl-ACP reductase [Skermania piniformis]